MNDISYDTARLPARLFGIGASDLVAAHDRDRRAASSETRPPNAEPHQEREANRVKSRRAQLATRRTRSPRASPAEHGTRCMPGARGHDQYFACHVYGRNC
jgi:hypothetical protein